jgi:hypothetical protein
VISPAIADETVARLDRRGETRLASIHGTGPAAARPPLANQMIRPVRAGIVRDELGREGQKADAALFGFRFELPEDELALSVDRMRNAGCRTRSRSA